MGDKSGISWTNSDDGEPGATWNPLLGCTKESPGCENCYAIRVTAQMQPGMRMANASYTGLVNTHRDGSHNWTGEVRELPERLTQPSRWARPRRIFVNSMSDLFHPSVRVEFIHHVFVEMAANPRHTFMVLTKRPARMAEVLGNPVFQQGVMWEATGRLEEDARRTIHRGRNAVLESISWPLPNVHLGTSVESGDYTSRIDSLTQAPAAVRFLSLEPLLGPVDLDPWLFRELPISEAPAEGLASGASRFFAPAPRIDWVITGGESGGPKERRLVEPCPHCTPATRADCEQGGNWHEGACTGWVPRRDALEWVTRIMVNCHSAGVAYFHKQWGGPTPRSGGHLIHGVSHQAFPRPYAVPV